jgi:thioredoxin 1
MGPELFGWDLKGAPAKCGEERYSVEILACCICPAHRAAVQNRRGFNDLRDLTLTGAGPAPYKVSSFRASGFWTLQIHFTKQEFPIPSEACMSDQITHVTDESFDPEVLKSDVPVLVDYWAEWCGPCKAVAPVLDEVAREYSGKLKVAKLNVDENQEIPKKYGIRGIPTLMLFKNGNIEATKVGALSKSQLTAFLDSNI